MNRRLLRILLVVLVTLQAIALLLLAVRHL